MRFWKLTSFLAVFCSLLISEQVSAQNAGALWKVCSSGATDQKALSACTKLLNKFKINDKAVKALVFYQRSRIYLFNSNLDQAFKDVNAAIKLNPGVAEYYLDRGVMYDRAQDLDRAIADQTMAITLKPDFALAYSNRGDLYSRKGNLDQALIDLNESIRLMPNYANSYYMRGSFFLNKKDYERAIIDLTQAIRLQPDLYVAYYNRAVSHVFKADYSSAMSDINEVIRLNPNFALGYNGRAHIYYAMGDYDNALANVNHALTLAPNQAEALSTRGEIYYKKGELDLALADFNTSLVMNNRLADAYGGRGSVYFRKGSYDTAIADLNTAIQLKPELYEAYYLRGQAWEAKGDLIQAKRDYYQLLSMPQVPVFGAMLLDVRARIAKLEGSQNQTVVTNRQAPESLQTAKVSSSANDRKIALVIGNSSYSDAGRLANPSRDASAIAASFRRLGFAEVIELHDLDYSAFKKALKDFGDKASTADWAVIYYAGHGIQVSNTNYLIPTDAKLVSASHVEDEAIPLNHLLSKVNDAKKMRLVILDSCRDNPFSKKMMADSKGTRSVSRGLALVEPDSGTLVAYAARDGQVANDGETGQNSPYTQALLQHLEEPGLDIGLLFRKVRDSVMTSTGKKQEPFTYGSLPGVTLSFK